MTTKNILFISYDGMTDPLGQSQVIPYLSGLSDFGYTFTILSCDKPDKYRQHGDYVQQLLAPYPIKWVSIPYHKKPPVISSWYDYRAMKKAAVRLHQQQNFDLVHTRVGTPALLGLWLKKKYGIKALNDIRGFWADERVDGGIWNIQNPVYNFLYRFFKKKEREYLSVADHNTCLTAAAKKLIQDRIDIPNQPVPVEVIPCSADMELFNPATIDVNQQKELRSVLKIGESDLVISYLGSIGGWYLNAEMMQFCKLLSDKIPTAKFLFISPHEPNVIEAAAAEQGLSADKLVVKAARRNEVPLLLSLSNYSMFFIKPCYSKMASSPTKHGEIMAMGIPVIANGGVGDVKEIIEKYKGGYVVDDFTDQSFNRVIESIQSGKQFDPVAIRAGAIEFYSLQNALIKYRKVYNAIFNK